MSDGIPDDGTGYTTRKIRSTRLALLDRQADLF